jgi:inorganic triphosphatase YgiF
VGRVREEDLAHFAVADGLLARMAADPGHMSEAERDYLLLLGAAMLAEAADLDPAQAYRLICPMTAENGTLLQAGFGFAAVTAYGRLLYTIKRHKLRGICHPDLN